jgi:hypothetical protein
MTWVYLNSKGLFEIGWSMGVKFYGLGIILITGGVVTLVLVH